MQTSVSGSMRGFRMITLIIGGSGSGKSAYAEDYVLAAAADLPKYYIATMQVYDAEGERKVERHRRLRAGKGFVTIEQPTDIAKAGLQIVTVQQSECRQKMNMVEVSGAVDEVEVKRSASIAGAEKEETQNASTALLECMSNLVANEMFSSEQMSDVDTVVEEIVQGIASLTSQLSHLVIVSNNVFEDGIEYDATTLQYIEALGRINSRIAGMADRVVEVVVGIPVIVK